MFEGYEWICSVLLMASGLTIMSYRHYAAGKGLKVGSLYARGNVWLMMLAALALLGGFIEGFFAFTWYANLLYLTIACLTYPVLVVFFRSTIQILAPMLAVACLIIKWVYFL